jgi:hypothetical protein
MTPEHMTRSRTLAIVAFAFSGSLLAALPALAQTISIVPACARAVTQEAPSLLCGLQTFGNIAQLILGLSGALVLLMFVWGGFQMLTAFGDSAKIGKGKEIIKNAVVGLVIVLISGTLVNYGLSYLVRNPAFKVVGNQCSGTGEAAKADPNGPGIFILVPKPIKDTNGNVTGQTSEIMCVTSCASIGNNYKDTATPAANQTCVQLPNGKYCCRAE